MHIQNILYYDTEIFDALGLEPPLTYDALLTAAIVIQEAYPEMYPLALGTSEKWEAAFLFDSILLEIGGPKYYVNLYKGDIDVATDPIFADGLSKMQALIPYIYPTHHDLTWDESCGLVTSGDSAMVLMGTWGIGYFMDQGWEPEVDFSAVTFPQHPERILLFHPDTYGLAAGAPHSQTTLDWLKVVASPELQIPTDVIQGGLFARIDIDPGEFPDPIRQELQAYVSENPEKLILDQHGSIAPLNFTQTYWEVIAAFIDNPDVEGTVREVADQLMLYSVKSEASWYVWP
jgi:ABC-type glycerol-3-phosphate transport system substrate-binding protein